jgi:hypothetical protein
MKQTTAFTGILAIGIVCVVGCSPRNSTSETIAEGTIFYAEFQKEGGGTEGFTRINDVGAVPGKNGSWNVDAHGRLTRDFLIITRPRLKDLGPQVIPTKRLVSVQFGDGGIRQVTQNDAVPSR